jgi:hypothetical protein
LQCKRVVARLPLLAEKADDGALFSMRAGKHIANCLRCQAELAKYGRLRRELALLAKDTRWHPAPGVVLAGGTNNLLSANMRWHPAPGVVLAGFSEARRSARRGGLLSRLAQGRKLLTNGLRPMLRPKGGAIS